MSDKIILDAMIRRADFWQLESEKLGETHESARQARAITFENLKADSNFVLNLRKPDFQRETNQWNANQVVSFIQSFIDGELVPSVILWQSSEGFIFAIDGAHRLSALRAWIEDDYGDGQKSIAYFDNEIPESQKKAAQKLREKLSKTVGSYKSLRDKQIARDANPKIEIDTVTSKRLRHLASRELELQWVGGDADVAEISFFKINTQGTPLDKTEEELLRNRHKAPAIAARSIVRAATGHKYWSKFSDDKKAKIESLSQRINTLIFQPEIKSPIKSLNLPIGGSGSTLDALSILMRLLSITESSQQKKRPSLKDSDEDSDGSKTVEVLSNCLSVVERMTGNGEGSLGLHPAIYFYSEQGKNMADMFLGIAYLVKLKKISNDDGFYRKFTEAREELEEFLRTKKALVSAILFQIRSGSRIERVGDMISYLVTEINAGKAPTIEGMAAAARMKGNIVALREKVEGKSFSDETKSAIYLRQSLAAAMRCPICKGYLEPESSASYDHVIRKQDGGTGDEENGQIAHPYCNTGFKS